MKGGLSLNITLLLLCIIFALNALGFTSGYAYLAGFDFSSDAGFYLMITGVVGAFMGAIAGALVSKYIGGTYSVIYTIPAGAFLGGIGSTLIMPIGFLINAGIPTTFKVLLMGILYFMIMAAAEGFIRGGEA